MKKEKTLLEKMKKYLCFFFFLSKIMTKFAYDRKSDSKMGKMVNFTTCFFTRKYLCKDCLKNKGK